MTEQQKKEHAKRALKRAKAAEEAATRKAEKQVMIEKAVNLKLMCDYAVSCSYGDLVLVIAMLHDYIELLDEVKADDITYQAYYRNRFRHIADHLAEQIGYDYEAALEKCKNRQWDDDKSDVGEDAMVLAYKKNVREAERKEKERQEAE